MTMEEAYLVVGGFSLSAALVYAFKGVANTIFEAGQALGSALRRLSGGNLCVCK